MHMKLIATLMVGMAVTASAWAHVTVAPREAPAGSYLKAVFQVPHGCDGGATTGIHVTLPEGIVIAKPEPKPGWRLTIRHAALSTPVQNEGHTLTERVSEVSWQGGELPDAEFDEFVILVRLPTEQGRVSFPVIQSCGTHEVRWVQEPASDRSEKPPPHPAPSVRLTPRP